MPATISLPIEKFTCHECISQLLDTFIVKQERTKLFASLFKHGRKDKQFRNVYRNRINSYVALQALVCFVLFASQLIVLIAAVFRANESQLSY